jgi:hypothetical protein
LHPPLLFAVEIESTGWEEYRDKFGLPAVKVPEYIRRIASSNADVHVEAIQQLHHALSLSPAAAPALPYLLQLAMDQRLPDKQHICFLLDEIAEKSWRDFELVKRKWQLRGELLGESYDDVIAEQLDIQIESMLVVRTVLTNELSTIHQLARHPDSVVNECGQSILRYMQINDLHG